MAIIDDIIKFLRKEQINNPNVYVNEKVLNDFLSIKKIVNSDLKPESENIYDKIAATGKKDTILDRQMQDLYDSVMKCKKCVLCEKKLNYVFGEGNIKTDIMFIGEGPGEDEDIQGRPFVGRSGQLLTKMIEAMGYKREEVYIANIVKCRPPGNRNPHQEEAEACLPYLYKQIEIIKPKVIVLLGAVPLKYLLNKFGITKIHGEWFEFNGIKTLPTFHPSFLLRDPSQKRNAWNDLKKVMVSLGKLK